MDHVKIEKGGKKKQPVMSEGKSKNIVYFQDFFGSSGETKKKVDDFDKGEVMMEPSEIFFELANAPYVGFKKTFTNSEGKRSNATGATKINTSRDSAKKKNYDKKDEIPAIIIKQENDCQSHTGGIVWETSYLLAIYLQEKFEIDTFDPSTTCAKKGSSPLLGKLLEVGSGCGMLGLIMSSSQLCKKVVMTETNEVMPNLIKNLKYNISSDGFCSSEKVSARQLRWDAYKEDIRNSPDDLEAHSFDTILGTDVIFSTSLVKPLLSTLRKMSHDGTQVYLCVQVRCADSHALFLKKTEKYGFVCNDITEELKSMKKCAFGLELDCKLYLLQRRCKNIDQKIRKSRKRKGDIEMLSKSSDKCSGKR